MLTAAVAVHGTVTAVVGAVAFFFLGCFFASAAVGARARHTVRMTAATRPILSPREPGLSTTSMSLSPRVNALQYAKRNKGLTLIFVGIQADSGECRTAL